MPISLDDIVRHKREEVAARKEATPLPERVVVPDTPPRFEQALRRDGQDIQFILEIKPASPSAGVLREKPDLPGILQHYNRYASALSVLTDEKFFNGSLALMAEVQRQSPLPVLRKDFILDSYQLYEARLAQADAVLLIAKILTNGELAALHTLARQLGLTPVVEIQNEAELARALILGPSVLLINNRNLETFEIDLETTLRLVPQIPEGICTISASGIESRGDIDQLLPVCRRFLIGSALMKTPPDGLSAKLAELSGR